MKLVKMLLNLTFTAHLTGCVWHGTVLLKDPGSDSWTYQLETDEFGAKYLASVYWAFTTMTTVGYGDHYPNTLEGQLCTACCMLCGIFVLGLPIVVIGQTFDEVYKEEEEEMDSTNCGCYGARERSDASSRRRCLSDQGSGRVQRPDISFDVCMFVWLLVLSQSL